MTSFSKEEVVVTSQDEKKIPKIEKPELTSRLKSEPKKWEEAIRFSTMLTYCRPHLSRTEKRFINEFIRPVGVQFDKKGNMYKRIGDAPVLWSSHVDTVHTKKGFQKIEYWVDKNSGDTFLGVARNEKSSCLGADDTTGVWLMLEMIRNNVPGLYIFHRGEECGGIGSRWIANNNVEILKDIRFAIAFDRRETDSIITYQRSTRCCSDEFANSLAAQLGMKHKCDETGAFTDTASYVDHIAECTNVSSGYYDAHSRTENVNIDYLFKLRDAICKIDISKLVESRKPGENTRKTYSYSGSHYYNNFDEWGWSSYGYDYRGNQRRPEGAVEYSELVKLCPDGWQGKYQYDGSCGFWMPVKPAIEKKEKKRDLGVTKLSPWIGKKTANHEAWDDYYDRYRLSFTEAVTMIRNNPEIIADLLETQGYAAYEVRKHIKQCGGNTITN